MRVLPPPTAQECCSSRRLQQQQKSERLWGRWEGRKGCTASWEPAGNGSRFIFFRCVNGHNPPKPSCDTAPAPGQSRGSHPSFQKGNFPNLCNFPLPFFLLPLHQPKVSLNSKIPPGAAWGAETETNRARKWSSPN